MASATSLYEIFKSLSNIKYSTLNLLVLAATVYSLPMWCICYIYTILGGRDYMKHIKVGRHGLYGAGQDLGNDCFKAKTPY